MLESDLPEIAFEPECGDCRDSARTALPVTAWDSENEKARVWELPLLEFDSVSLVALGERGEHVSTVPSMQLPDTLASFLRCKANMP